MTIIAALLIFTLVVLVHELGHFWAARRAGIFVEEFSIGMGPRLISFVKNETRYSLKLFPIGGSCLMLGEDEAADDARSFGSKSVRWRIVVIAAGAIMNFVLALVIFTVMAMFTDTANTTVRGFTATSPVQEAGVQIGDRIVRVNGRSMNVFGNFNLEMLRTGGNPVDIVVERDGVLHSFTITPYYTDERHLLGFVPGLTVAPFSAETMTAEDGRIIYIDQLEGVRRASFFESLGRGFNDMLFSIELVIFSLGLIITGNFNIGDMMGPLGIVATVGEQIEGGMAAGGGLVAFWSALNFAALISANLGVFNLLPIPALDGGRLVFLTIEGVRRKPINPDKEGMVHFVGLMALLVLIAFVTYQDILRLFA